MIQRKEEEGDTDDKDRDGGGGAEAVFVLPARPPACPTFPFLPPHNQFDMLHDRRSRGRRRAA